jgi:hypothetical protein
VYRCPIPECRKRVADVGMLRSHLESFHVSYYRRVLMQVEQISQQAAFERWVVDNTDLLTTMPGKG